MARLVMMILLSATTLVHAAGIGYDSARHLLNRTGFAASEKEINTYAELTREAAIDRLLAQILTQAQTEPPAWIKDPIISPRKLREMSDTEREAERKDNIEKGFLLREWWYREMLTTSSPLTEKMTLFWHNHFATSQQKVRYNKLMYQQNVLLRQHALGNFAVMLKAIAKDPAMLIYLDGAANRKGQPNENFAREVMELFTLGEGRYSEQDIKEVARAFTGWSIDQETGEFLFRRGIHDNGEKNILGKKGKFDGDAVLDILLARPETGEFIVSKLWLEFVSPTPDKQQVSRIGKLFRENEYDIKTLLRALLTTDAFYAEENRAGLIKSPVELLIGSLRQFSITPENLRPVVLAGALLGQNVLSPPNVKGWPGGEHWINSTSLLGRKQFLERLLRAEEMPQASSADTVKGKEARMTRQMERGINNVQFDSAAWLANVPKTAQERRSKLPRLLLATAPLKAIDSDLDGIALVRHIVMDPVYQLK